MEALVRWQHPERGLLMPGDFLDLAERAGTMRELTLRVSRLGRRPVRATGGTTGSSCAMSVNPRPAERSRSAAFPTTWLSILAGCGLPAGALMLEITEDTIMADPVRGMSVLAGLAELGVGLAFDDFGTGWSSLAYLAAAGRGAEDRPLVRVGSMIDDHDDGVIVRSIVDLARASGCA